MFDAEAHAEVMEGVQYVARAPKLMQILEAVSAVHRIGKRDLMSHSRLGNIASARHEFYWLARHLSGRSLEQIGLFLNGRHHTTIMHGVEKVSREFNARRKSLLATLRALGIDTDRLTEVARERV